MMRMTISMTTIGKPRYDYDDDDVDEDFNENHGDNAGGMMMMRMTISMKTIGKPRYDDNDHGDGMAMTVKVIIMMMAKQ